MKIVVLTGSPNKNGTSFYMANKFIEGVEQNGNEVLRFDTAFMDIGFCEALDYCKSHDTVCALKDDFVQIREAVENCDLLVFVSPIYYFTFPAQFKKALDRFHSFGRSLRGKNAKGLVITTCADPRDTAPQLINAYFQKIIEYFHWDYVGCLNALGVGNREALLKTDYPNQAYQLGKSIK